MGRGIHLESLLAEHRVTMVEVSALGSLFLRLFSR